jgi:hypothetical protein
MDSENSSYEGLMLISLGIDDDDDDDDDDDKRDNKRWLRKLPSLKL